MAYIESDFISREQYDALEGRRLPCEEFETNELYVGMFALAKNSHHREAAKMPLEFRGTITKNEAGIYLASAALLKLDGTLKALRQGEYVDGYWVDVRDKLLLLNKDPPGKYVPLHSYIRTYDPEIDADLNMDREGALLAA